MLEPTYRRLKRALMDGIWPGGTRLEALRLAEEFGVSMTPVRDSLNQLVGEGLVDLTPGEGFRVAALGERSLRELLQLNLLVLESAAAANGSVSGDLKVVSPADDYADRIAAVFSQFAAESGNRVLRDLVTRIGARLHPVRRREPEILPRALEMLDELEGSLARTPGERRRVLRHYHRNCQLHVPRLIGLAVE